MNQLVITHADDSTSAYPVSDASVLSIDGAAVSLAGVTAVSLSEAPADATPAVPEASATEEPQPAPAATPDTSEPAAEASPAPAAPAVPATPTEATPDPSPGPSAEEAPQP